MVIEEVLRATPKACATTMDGVVNEPYAARNLRTAVECIYIFVIFMIISA